MQYQQTYVYDFRLSRATCRHAPAEPRFFTGLLNGIALSLPLWSLIVWAVKTLIG